MTTRVESVADRVDVYPVGWLAELRAAWRLLTYRPRVIDGLPALPTPAWRWRVGEARHALSRVWRHNVRHVRARDWHALKNTFNGYLAEPYVWPEDGSLRRCGSGWTRARALRSLRRHGWRH